MSFCRNIAGAAALFALSFAAGAAEADTVNWASLTDTSGGNVFGSIGSTAVTYSGGFSFAQLNNSAGNTDYWTTAVTNDYTQGLVNRPTGSDIIGLADANTGTITFSAPVGDIYIAFNSWNGADVTFSSAFTVVSQGCGYWGCGSFTVDNNNMGFTGYDETVGVLKFSGVQSVTFTDTVYENWHGLTVGVSAAPEASTWAMMLFGFAGLGFVGYRSRKRSSAFA